MRDNPLFEPRPVRLDGFETSSEVLQEPLITTSNSSVSGDPASASADSSGSGLRVSRRTDGRLLGCGYGGTAEHFVLPSG